MTQEYAYIEEGAQPYDDPQTDDYGTPMHVIDVGPERHAPEFCNPVTFSIAQFSGTNTEPTMILQRRVRRHKARIFIDALGGGATSVVYNSKRDPLTNPVPQGGTITAVPKQIEWENQRPCYMVAIGGGPVLVTVQDESYADPEANPEIFG